MEHLELHVLSALRALLQIALMFYIGQSLLALLAAPGATPTRCTSSSCC